MNGEPESKSVLATVQRGPGGLQLRTFEELWSFSQCIVRSGMAPKGLDTQDKIVIALELGSELGLKPLQSLQNIAVINGRPCVYGDAMLALCQGSGVWDGSAFREWYTPEGGSIEDADYTAHCQVRRAGANAPVECVFSVEDAKRAKLWKKQGPWSEYPQRMLMWRARTWACRNAFSDVLKGVNVAEEVRDMEQPVVDVPQSPSLPAPSSRGDAIAAMAPIVGGQGMPTPPGHYPEPTQAPEPAATATNTPEQVETPPEAVETITEAQYDNLRGMHAALDPAEELAFRNQIGIVDISELASLPADQYQEVFAELNAAHVLPDAPKGTPTDDAKPVILRPEEYADIKAEYDTLTIVAKQDFRAFAFGSSNTMFNNLKTRPSSKTAAQLMAWFEAQGAK